MNKPLPLEVGERVRFEGYQKRYTVQAASERFAVLTMSLPLHRTAVYTVIDWEIFERGTEPVMPGLGVDAEERSRKMLAGLEAGEEVSYRSRRPLDIIRRIKRRTAAECA